MKKDAEGVDTNEPAISDLNSFASTLAERVVLYVKADEYKNESFSPMLGITTLEEYFHWLKELSAVDRKYTMLPLDEPHFVINANTRAINIPDEFKKNGIAVQGDDLAEVVYFKVDRYFDYMDLNNCDIFIQWELPDKKKGVSKEYIRDIESETGKLIFGWALSDAITAAAGNLKFSVRFFQWNDASKINIDEAGKVDEKSETVLAYSFNTLTASVKIQPSIGFNLETELTQVDDAGNRLLGRIEDSVIVGGYEAAIPQFIVDLLTSSYDLEENGTKELLVQAFGEDSGFITYTWKRQLLSGDNSPEGNTIEVVDSTIAYVEAVGDYNPSYIYYELTKKGADPTDLTNYIVRSTGPLSDEEKEDGWKLYLKQSKCIADRAGDYWAVAENRMTNSASSKESVHARFPHPTPVNITSQPSGGVLTKTGDLAPKLTVAASNIENEMLTYQWEKDENHALNFEGKDPNYVELSGATSATYTPATPGHYRVHVFNNRNKEVKDAYSVDCRVTNPAEQPVLDLPLGEIIKYDPDEITSKAKIPTLTVQVGEGYEYDSHIFTWYLYEGNKAIEILKEEVVGLSSALDLNNEEIKAKVINDTTKKTNIMGTYYAIVTNKLNGDSTDSTSGSFEITEIRPSGAEI